MFNVLCIICILLLICVTSGTVIYIPLVLLFSYINKPCYTSGGNTDDVLIAGGNVSNLERYNSKDEICIITYDRIMKHVNPKFIIKKEDGYNVIDESNLIGGTEQRIIAILLSMTDRKHVVYVCGTSNHTPLTVAYICKMMDKKITIFMNHKNKSPVTEWVKRMGVNIKHINKKESTATYKDLLNAAKKEYDDNNTYLLTDSMMKSCMYGVFNDIKELNPKRLWTTTGIISSILRNVLPSCKVISVSDIMSSIPKDAKKGDYIWRSSYNINDIHSELKHVVDMKQTYTLPKLIIPMHHMSMCGVNDMFNLLKKEAYEWEPSCKVHRTFNKDYYITDGISNHFTEEKRKDCIVNRTLKLSPNQFVNKFKDNIRRYYVFLYGDRVGETPESINRQLLGDVRSYALV